MAERYLITGGTGFLGRRLAKALKQRAEVVISGRNHDQNMIARDFCGCPVVALDVSRADAVRDVIAEFRPHVIIHAAASKHVDIAEHQPMECVDVNVLGSQNVARIAIEHKVRVVVGISTDKAAPPVSNTYGLTKALMERMFCALDGKTSTAFVCVRPGNIPWSTGSFLPVWTRMHKNTGVIGTTGPEMTRFFSRVSEVVKLVTTVIDQLDVLHGKVVTRSMKAARIGRFLELYVANRGGSWKRIEGRPGERQHELLIGEPELARTKIIEFDGVNHYVLAFNELVEQPLHTAPTSAVAEQLTDAEILDIINNSPEQGG